MYAPNAQLAHIMILNNSHVNQFVVQTVNISMEDVIAIAVIILSIADAKSVLMELSTIHILNLA